MVVLGRYFSLIRAINFEKVGDALGFPVSALDAVHEIKKRKGIQYDVNAIRLIMEIYDNGYKMKQSYIPTRDYSQDEDEEETPVVYVKKKVAVKKVAKKKTKKKI